MKKQESKKKKCCKKKMNAFGCRYLNSEQIARLSHLFLYRLARLLRVLLFGFQLDLSYLLPGLHPPARAFRSCTRSNNTLQIFSASSKPRLVLAGASRGGKEGTQCHHSSLLPSDLNPKSAADTVGALMCVHCSLTLSLSAMGPLSFHQN